MLMGIFSSWCPPHKVLHMLTGLLLSFWTDPITHRQTGPTTQHFTSLQGKKKKIKCEREERDPNSVAWFWAMACGSLLQKLSRGSLSLWLPPRPSTSLLKFFLCFFLSCFLWSFVLNDHGLGRVVTWEMLNTVSRGLTVLLFCYIEDNVNMFSCVDILF